jgi:small-conductance mechanosensitive channel
MNSQLVLDDLTQFTQLLIDKLPSLLLGVIIFVVFFWLSRPIANFLSKPLAKTTTSKLIQLVVRRTLSLFVILIGLYVLLRLAGLTQFAVALLSGTGVLGLIVGFAFKDIAENFLSSLLLSVQKPFKLGDIIEVEGYLGVVKKMTARATTLVDFNGDHIQLPNATIYKNAIRNLTANPNMRASFDIGIGYDADVSKAQVLAMNLMTSHSAVLDDPEPQVMVQNLGASSYNLRLYFWVNAELNSQFKVASVLMKKLVEAYLIAGISMPDDARERIILSAPEDPSPNPTSQVTTAKASKQTLDTKANKGLEDTSSDHDEIREQAAHARDPEEGQNIL